MAVVAVGGGAVADSVLAADHRRCHAPYGSNSVVDIYGNNCVQLCGRCIENVSNEIKNKHTKQKIVASGYRKLLGMHNKCC